MITILGCTLLIMTIVGWIAGKLDDSPTSTTPPDDESPGGWDALIFLLCLLGIVLHKRKAREDD